MEGRPSLDGIGEVDEIKINLVEVGPITLALITLSLTEKLYDPHK
jgi:hypothetical protein